MSDYLWNKTGDVDSDVAQLENALQSLRFQTPPRNQTASEVLPFLAAPTKTHNASLHASGSSQPSAVAKTSTVLAFTKASKHNALQNRLMLAIAASIVIFIGATWLLAIRRESNSNMLSNSNIFPNSDMLQASKNASRESAPPPLVVEKPDIETPKEAATQLTNDAAAGGGSDETLAATKLIDSEIKITSNASLAFSATTNKVRMRIKFPVASEKRDAPPIDNDSGRRAADKLLHALRIAGDAFDLSTRQVQTEIADTNVSSKIERQLKAQIN